MKKEREEEGSRAVVGRECLYHEKEWWGKRRGSRTVENGEKCLYYGSFREGEGKEKKRTLGKKPQGPVNVDFILFWQK